LEDHVTALQTSQALLLVSTVPVRVEQPLRRNISGITSAYRILSPLDCVSHCRGFNFCNGVGSDFEIDTTS
jgi:hypothetical protein